MYKLTALAERFFSTNLKKLYKAGFIDEKNELTDDGREVLEILVLEQFMDELVGEAERKIKEEKEK